MPDKIVSFQTAKPRSESRILTDYAEGADKKKTIRVICGICEHP